jgi:hypothetical protein
MGFPFPNLPEELDRIQNLEARSDLSQSGTIRIGRPGEIENILIAAHKKGRLRRYRKIYPRFVFGIPIECERSGDGWNPDSLLLHSVKKLLHKALGPGGELVAQLRTRQHVADFRQCRRGQAHLHHFRFYKQKARPGRARPPGGSL